MAKQPIPFVILDSTVLTNGIRVMVAGVDIEQFKKNAVLLFDHNEWTLPIGRVDNVRKEADQILGDVIFDYEDDDKDVKRIIGKVERGFINACSPGLVDLEGTDDSLYKLNGQDNITITKCRLREVSIVAIGKNHSALRLYDKDGAEIQYAENPKLLLSDFIVSPKIKIDMKINFKKLNLADGATDDQVNDAIELLLSDKKKAEDDLAAEKLKADAAETAKNDLQTKLDDLALADKTAKKNAFEKELNSAFLDGRLSEKPVEGKPTPVKDRMLNLFDKDAEGTMEMIKDLPVRTPKSIELSDAATTGSAWEKRKAEIEANTKK